jgi:hypothetical protein
MPAAHIERRYIEETGTYEQRCRCRRRCNGDQWIPARTWRRHQAEERELIAEEQYGLDLLDIMLPMPNPDVPDHEIIDAQQDAAPLPPLLPENDDEGFEDDEDKDNEPNGHPDPFIASPPPSPPPGHHQPLHQDVPVHVPDGIDGLPQPTLEHLRSRHTRRQEVV